MSKNAMIIILLVLSVGLFVFSLYKDALIEKQREHVHEVAQQSKAEANRIYEKVSTLQAERDSAFQQAKIWKEKFEGCSGK